MLTCFVPDSHDCSLKTSVSMLFSPDIIKYPCRNPNIVDADISRHRNTLIREFQDKKEAIEGGWHSQVAMMTHMYFRCQQSSVGTSQLGLKHQDAGRNLTKIPWSRKYCGLTPENSPMTKNCVAYICTYKKRNAGPILGLYGILFCYWRKHKGLDMGWPLYLVHRDLILEN